MARYEISITPNYVKDWTTVEAVRELFQNALDQQTTTDANNMSWSYDPDAQTLIIANKSSELHPRTLLLGSTSKDGDAATIGQFGEGYKIAALVLCREQRPMTIYNYGRRETWRPRFVKSRKYDTELLVFEVQSHVWGKVPNNSLTIEVGNIDPAYFEDHIKPSILFAQAAEHKETMFDTVLGSVLSHETQRGRVYVNGLYVCTYPKYQYGYDFKPGVLHLDRDRKMVSDFNLQWEASRIWLKAPVEQRVSAVALAETDMDDVKYLTSVGFSSATAIMRDACYEAFVAKYGDKAVPVTDLILADRYRKNGYHPVQVPAGYASLITGSHSYTAPSISESDETPEDLSAVLQDLYSWYAKYIQDAMTDSSIYDQFHDIHQRLKNVAERTGE